MRSKMNFDNYRLELLGPVDCTAATTRSDIATCYPQHRSTRINSSAVTPIKFYEWEEKGHMNIIKTYHSNKMINNSVKITIINKNINYILCIQGFKKSFLVVHHIRIYS